MTDAEIIKALECCCKNNNCEGCPLDYLTFSSQCASELAIKSLDLINRLQAENENLEYKLLGVMHSVDKWLDGDELKQDEVNRAATMREKTLRLIETAKAEVMTEFAEELKEKLELCDTVVGSDDFGVTIEVGYEMEDVNETIDNLVKEMVGEEE